MKVDVASHVTQAANDDIIRVTFKEAKARVGLSSSECATVVPVSTYARDKRGARPILFDGRLNMIQSGQLLNEDGPTFMYGSWALLTLSRGTLDSFRAAVIDRFISRHRLTVLNAGQAQEVIAHMFKLFNKKEKHFKRDIYFRSSTQLDIQSLYGHVTLSGKRVYMCYVRGKKFYGLTEEKRAIIKAITRRLTKLNELATTSGEVKWHQLIQQAI